MSFAAVFAVGFVGGGLVVLTVQSRPAPAVRSEPLPPPVSVSATRSVAAHPADVLRVIDGDTFEARVHVWPGLDITTKIRLRGIDAPELRARCPAERTMAEAARDALGAMLAEGRVGISGVTLDKYGGRVVCGHAVDCERVGGIAGEGPCPPLRRRPAPRLVR